MMKLVCRCPITAIGKSPAARASFPGVSGLAVPGATAACSGWLEEDLLGISNHRKRNRIPPARS